MKITIEATSQVTHLNGVEVRVWEGTTERGTPCLVFVHRMSVKEGLAEEFMEELRELTPPAETVGLGVVLRLREVENETPN